MAAAWLPRYLADQLPFNVEFGLTWQASLQGLGVGLLISLLFSLVPLLEIRQIKPILVLRSLTGGERRRFDWVKIVAGLLVGMGVLAIASWQGGSLRIGGIFLASLASMTIVLNLAATVLMKLLSRLRHTRSFVWRQGISSLYRPGNQTRIILMAVGLGVFFIVGVRSLQLNLRNEFSLDLDAVRADLYLIDIQNDQRSGVEAIVSNYTGAKPLLIPTVRARIAKIDAGERNPDHSQGAGGQGAGSQVTPAQRPTGQRGGPAREQRGMFGREYVLTYRPYLEDYEKILDGQFWDPTPSIEPEVSIEELLHDELDLNVGDAITFDVQGAKITARVTSIRRVDWRNARTGFFIVFRPGALEQAPTMYISAIKGPAPGQHALSFSARSSIAIPTSRSWMCSISSRSRAIWCRTSRSRSVSWEGSSF
jgi:putative ABC transport system permease protein